MRSMREIMTLMEAPVSKKATATPPATDSDALKGRVMSLMSILSGMHIEFDTDWANKVVEEFKQKKHAFDSMVAQERERYPDEFNAGDYEFEVKDELKKVATDVLKRNSVQHRMLGDITTAERVYQDSLVKDPDDWSDMVEDSAFLRGLQAQRQFASAVLVLEITEPSTYGPVLDTVDDLLKAFNSFKGSQETREPEIVPSVYQELADLLPMMRVVLTLLKN